MIEEEDGTHDDYPILAEQEIANIIFPGLLVLGCPNKGCNTWFKVRPIRLNTNWHYRSKCPTCGALSSVLKRIQTKCAKCGKVNFASEQNRLGGCDCTGVKLKNYRSPVPEES